MRTYPSVATWLFSGALLIGTPLTLAAQNVPGVTGTIQPDSGRDDVDAAGHIVAGGLKALFRGKESDVQLLDPLREGSPVSVRYAKDGIEAADRAVKDDPATEGIILDVDRKDKTIRVRFANGTRETFRLADHQTLDTAKGRPQGADDVVVYYVDPTGQRVGIDFKKTS
jgi:hypothetical protein